MPYTATSWVNGTTPAINATNLNKLTNELKSQAIAQSVANTLPTWANGIAPAVSDPIPLNELERVTQLVAQSLGIFPAYVKTTWASGWVPARNATALNKLEQAAVANRIAIDGSGSTTPIAPQPPITVITQQGICLNVAASPQTLYQDYDLSYSGDSTIIMGPTGQSPEPVTTFRRFLISHVFEGPGQQGSGTHGVYCKRDNVLFQDFNINTSHTDTFSLRHPGIVVDRFTLTVNAGGYDFITSYFEESTVAGLCTIKNGTASTAVGGSYFMWTGSNPDAPVPAMKREFLFQNVHVTGSVNAWIGIEAGMSNVSPGVTLQNCTINGNPVTAGQIQGYNIISIT